MRAEADRGVWTPPLDTEGANHQGVWTMTEHRDTGASQEARQRAEEAQGQTQQMPGERAQAEPTVPQARRSGEAEYAEGRRPSGAGEMAEMMARMNWGMYAGVLLIVLGGFQAIWGVTGVVKTTVFLVGTGALILPANYVAWGWVHIGVAIVLIATGLAILARQAWARYVGIALCAIGAFANFLTLGAFPLWSLILIGLDILAIYALAVHGKDFEPASRRASA